MPKKINNIIKVSLITIVSAVLVVQVADAAVLSTIYDRLSFVDQNLSSGVDHNLVFTTVGAVDGPVSGYAILRLRFPNADDGLWCRTNGALAATNNAEDGATGLPGTLSASCTKGIDGSTYDTIYICAAGGAGVEWAALTKYSVQVKDSTGELGTLTSAANNIKVDVLTGTHADTCGAPSSDVDTGEYALSILADGTVAVSATVDPLLSFAVTDLDIGFGTFSSTAKRYANSDKSGDIGEAGNDEPTKITVSTNAANGLVVSARSKGDGSGADGNGSAGLYKSSGTTRLIPAATALSITTGTEGYALYVKNKGNNLTVSVSWLDESATGTISTSGQTIISTAGTISTLNTADVALEAAIATDTLAGSYADIITLTGTGKF